MLGAVGCRVHTVLRSELAVEEALVLVARLAGEAVGGESADAVYFGTPQVGGVPDRLIFDAPEGTTRVCLIYTTRKSGFRDEYINMVDKVSCDTLIEAVYEPHYEHFAESLVARSRVSLPMSRLYEREGRGGRCLARR